MLWLQTEGHIKNENEVMNCQMASPMYKYRTTFKPKMQSVILKLLNWAFMLSAGSVCAQSDYPAVAAGRIDRIEVLRSRYIGSRFIDVWLPEGYNDGEKYAVLYMQDGQMLFDSSQTWNRQAWNIDDSSAALMKHLNVKKWIVVGIYNGGNNRHREYFPGKPFKYMNRVQRDSITAQLKQAGRVSGEFKPLSDAYLKFLVKVLKPHIEKKYSVYTNPENTFIGGSSMGGLISLYAVCKYPAVFGGAACLSTHWPGSFQLQNNYFPLAMQKYLNKKLPKPGRHRFYFDCGDQTLDSMYGLLQDRVDSVFLKMGYDSTNFKSLRFVGANHSERAWSMRLRYPLEFLFRKN